MAIMDKIKAQIEWLKVIFGILVVTLFSLCGWIVVNYEKQPREIMFFAFAALVCISVGTWICNHVAQKKIQELEEL